MQFIVCAILFLLAGLILGGGIMWLAGRVRAARAGAETTILGERLAEREREIEELGRLREEQTRAIDTLNERVTGLTGELRAWQAEAERVPSLEAEIRNMSEQLRRQAELAAGLEMALTKERQASQEKEALLDEARAKLMDTFKALASEALSRNNESFLQLAMQNLEKERETAKGDLDKKHQAIGELVGPLREQLARYEQQMGLMEKERNQSYGKLLEQVTKLDLTQKNLERETSHLVQALRSPKVRGQWGEITLRRVAELAGMVEHCDFFEQTSAATEDGLRRPDMIVRLPGGRQIVIDAKTPLESYLKSLEMTEESARNEALQMHANHLQRHMDQLSQKAYWNLFNPAPDFVVLFIPGESFLGAALERRPELLEHGFEKKVILATPATLISLLRTVALGWRQEALARNAAEISGLGQLLYERLSTMAEHMAGLGTSLERSVKSYNQAVGSLEKRVMVTARKFTELGLHAKKELPELVQIETTPALLEWAATPRMLGEGQTPSPEEA